MTINEAIKRLKYIEKYWFKVYSPLDFCVYADEQIKIDTKKSVGDMHRECLETIEKHLENKGD